MNTHADKTQENKSQSVANAVSQKRNSGKSTFQFEDNRPEAVVQRKLQEMANNSPQAIQLKACKEMINDSAQSAPIQMSGGSTQANEELVKAMGKSADLVDNLPKAKPHSKKGTGSSGTDHQGRNAMVINKAKRDTAKAHDDPTMFSSSRMRGDARGKEKSAAAAEKRREKAEATDTSMGDFDKAMEQATKTYKGDQEKFDEYLENRNFEFSEDQMDNLYEALYKE
ncbi:hypothetical protein P872_14195 [Rhodonellum psychrophilum GCM71 = DSM 17998]|uniref:Uncharacterized protein n=2 Tax=Rhodonellum TaxID=336827 RepID=U5BRU1_9BACT|nr:MULTISPECIES: hypothetical protein [Rhodonellum]ERM80239.1 hypothetical protein P872_14195 [Rhodonellum psychrophilum GCM71 = DSM 17998]SDZ58136.1 hypothetical protein SAMN05444412_1333 [Rhodonellum ikkaensis]